MTLLQLLNQEFIEPELGWSFCLSRLTDDLNHGYDNQKLIANMLLLKQMAGVKNRKWRYSPLDTGYTRCLC